MSRNEKNNIITNIKKAKTSSQKTTKEDKVVKTPLYKIFMDENISKKKKKFHLKKNHTVYSNKNTQVQMNMMQSNNFSFVFNLNLELFSYKILEAKYNCNPDLYEKFSLDNLIAKKKCHYLAEFNEMGFCTSILREYLKREYTLKEVKTRIPQYANYYKNYLIFFCKPCFTQYTINKKMVRHMEKVAQIFYNENYADEEKEEKKEESQEKKKLPKIFNKEVIKDIENCGSFTYVNSEATNEQIQLINKKLKRTEKEPTENKKINKVERNKAFPIEIEQSSIIEENHKITPIYQKKEFEQKIKNNKKIVFDMEKSNEILDNNYLRESQSINSINLLIKEMDKDNKGNLLLKNLKDLNENPYTFRKINAIISPANKLNVNAIKTKSIKNVNNNCILIQNGKTTNNINININNLTIGQKLLSPNASFNRIIKNLKELNNINNMNNDKILKKTITKFKYRDSNNNSLLKTKDKNARKSLKNMKNNTESAPHGNKIQNIQMKNKIKKNGLLTLPPQAMNLLPNFHTNSTNKNYNKIIPGTLTSQVKKTRNQPIFRLGHNSGSTTNLYKNKKLYYYNNSKEPSKLGRFTIYASDQYTFKNTFNNNFKNQELLSEERTTNNVIKKPKKIFTSIMEINKGNRFINLKSKLDTYKNNKIANIISPMNANKKELVINKMKIKELKLKENQFNLHKLLNIAPTNKRSKSTCK